MDKSNSVVEWFDDDDYIVEAISLDDEVLSKVPLESRLLFRPVGASSDNLIHESLVNELQELNIDGLEFSSVSDILSLDKGDSP